MAVYQLVWILILASLFSLGISGSNGFRFQNGLSMKCIRTVDPESKLTHHVLINGGHVNFEGTLVCTPVENMATIKQVVNLVEELQGMIKDLNTEGYVPEEKLIRPSTTTVTKTITTDKKTTTHSTTTARGLDRAADLIDEEYYSCEECRARIDFFQSLVALSDTELNLDAFYSCGMTPGPDEELKKQSSSNLLLSEGDHPGESKPAKNLTQKEASEFASLLISNEMLPSMTDDEHLNRRLAYCLVLMNTGHIYEAIEELNSLIKNNPNLHGAYHARGAAYARHNYKDLLVAESALRDFNRAIELNRQNPLGWEQRGELHLLVGRPKSALSDISKALELRPTAKLYLIRGGLLLKERRFSHAMTDFFNSLRRKVDQPDAFHLLGVSFFHQGKLHEAASSIRQAVKMKPDCLDCLQDLGQVYKEIGDYISSLDVLNHALEVEWNDMLTHYLRGLLYLDTGLVDEAITDFKTCASLEPNGNGCERMVAVCLALKGQFYEAVKSAARVMILNTDNAEEYDRAMYIKELCRYFHARLDVPNYELDLDRELSAKFRDGWVRDVNFPDEGYVEQPGIRPDIGDVDHLGFYDYSPDVQDLICKGVAHGRLAEHTTDGFLANDRQSLAMGLAAIEIAQAMRQYWKAPKIYKNHAGKRFSWRDLFDITMKWTRACNPDKPILWLDMMPEHCIQHKCDSFKYQILLLHGQTFNIRYENYVGPVLNATKKLLNQYLLESSEAEDRLVFNLDEIDDLDVILNIMRKLKDVGRGFTIGSRIASHRKMAEKLEGVSFEVKEDRPGELVFSMTSHTSKERTEHFHTEMDHVWLLLSEEMQNMRKSVGSPREGNFQSIGDLVLTLIYYFYNLMPVSDGPSSIAYSVAIGLFIATGREVTGSIPKGKIVELEAMLSSSPSAFSSTVKQWMNLQKTHLNVSSLPSVIETFPTLRTMLEVLNIDTEKCHH